MIIPCSSVHDVLDLGEIELRSLDPLVQFSEIDKPSDSSILFGNDKGWEAPFRVASGCNDPFINKMLAFPFEDILVSVGDWIWIYINWFRSIQ